MSYYFKKALNCNFDEGIERITLALKNQGFGILTDINVKTTLKEKINVDFRRYRILGACNPKMAHKALLAEDKIGVLLPCSVVVQELGQKQIEIAVMNPAVTMAGVKNKKLECVAEEVQILLENALINA